MAQRIQTLCDWHLTKKEEEVDGRPRNVPITYKKTRVDLCDDCYQEHFEIPLGAIRDLLEDLGARAPEGPSQPPLDVPTARPKIACPEQGCDYAVSSRSSYRSHMPEAHGVSLAIWEGRHKRTIEGDEVEYFCDWQDCEAGFTTPQGKGAHMSAEHDYVSPDTSKPSNKSPAKKATAKKAS